MDFKKILFIKCVELVLLIVGIVEGNEGAFGGSYFISGTYIGFVIISGVLAISYIIKSPIDKRLDILFSFIGIIFFIACASVLIRTHILLKNHPTLNLYRNIFVSLIIISVINALVFLIDGGLTYLRVSPIKE